MNTTNETRQAPPDFISFIEFPTKFQETKERPGLNGPGVVFAYRTFTDGNPFQAYMEGLLRASSHCAFTSILNLLSVLGHRKIPEDRNAYQVMDSMAKDDSVEFLIRYFAANFETVTSSFAYRTIPLYEYGVDLVDGIPTPKIIESDWVFLTINEPETIQLTDEKFFARLTDPSDVDPDYLGIAALPIMEEGGLRFSDQTVRTLRLMRMRTLKKNPDIPWQKSRSLTQKGWPQDANWVRDSLGIQMEPARVAVEPKGEAIDSDPIKKRVLRVVAKGQLNNDYHYPCTYKNLWVLRSHKNTKSLHDIGVIEIVSRSAIGPLKLKGRGVILGVSLRRWSKVPDVLNRLNKILMDVGTAHPQYKGLGSETMNDQLHNLTWICSKLYPDLAFRTIERGEWIWLAYEPKSTDTGAREGIVECLLFEADTNHLIPGLMPDRGLFVKKEMGVDPGDLKDENIALALAGATHTNLLGLPGDLVKWEGMRSWISDELNLVITNETTHSHTFIAYDANRKKDVWGIRPGGSIVVGSFEESQRARDLVNAEKKEPKLATPIPVQNHNEVIPPTTPSPETQERDFLVKLTETVLGELKVLRSEIESLRADYEHVSNALDQVQERVEALGHEYSTQVDLELSGEEPPGTGLLDVKIFDLNDNSAFEEVVRDFMKDVVRSRKPRPNNPTPEQRLQMDMEKLEKAHPKMTHAQRLNILSSIVSFGLGVDTYVMMLESLRDGERKERLRDQENKSREKEAGDEQA